MIPDVFNFKVKNKNLFFFRNSGISSISENRGVYMKGRISNKMVRSKISPIVSAL